MVLPLSDLLLAAGRFRRDPARHERRGRYGDRRLSAMRLDGHLPAEQLHVLQQELETARAFARSYGTAADRAEHLYRRESAKAWMHVEGRNADERAGAVHEWPLDGAGLEDSAAVSAAMGLDGSPCSTVGELRWLRDRAQRLADQWSATAYDRRNRVSAWMTVASMAKTEAELGGAAPEHGSRAVAS